MTTTKKRKSVKKMKNESSAKEPEVLDEKKNIEQDKSKELVLKESQSIIEKEETAVIEKEIESAVPQLFTEAQRRLVLNETPRWVVKQRKGKGGLFFDYVDVGYVIEQLNTLTGFRWNFEIEEFADYKEAKETGETWCQGKLTVFGKGEEKRIATDIGNSTVKFRSDTREFLSYGNDKKGAVSDCIKRCARQFGIALDVYSGKIKRRQDGEHPESPITDEQRKRLEVLATEAKIGHSGLKKFVAEQYDYTSTKDIQRRHFQAIQEKLSIMGAKEDDTVVPEEIAKGFEILGVPIAKQKATVRAYEKQEGGMEKLKAKINASIDEKDTKK
jgi:hypothetical protein